MYLLKKKLFIATQYHIITWYIETLNQFIYWPIGISRIYKMEKYNYLVIKSTSMWEVYGLPNITKSYAWQIKYLKYILRNGSFLTVNAFMYLKYCDANSNRQYYSLVDVASFFIPLAMLAWIES